MSQLYSWLNQNVGFPCVPQFCWVRCSTDNPTHIINRGVGRFRPYIIMHAPNISVYVLGFSTETLSILLDFYSDPYTELVWFMAERIDGVITDNPKTASAFIRSPCADPKSTAPFVFNPIKPGDYLAQVEPSVLPPAASPLPPPQVTYVVNPPLPPVNAAARKEGNDSGQSGGSSESGHQRLVVDVVMMSLLLIGLVFVT